VSKPTTWLVQLTHGREASDTLALGLDCILACGAFGQSVSVVLRHNAASLVHEKASDQAAGRNFFRELHSLPLYEIDRIFVLAEDVAADTPKIKQLEDLTIDYITHKDLRLMISDSKHVVSF
jgi:sulfur relay (sulfurtransferase) DsrF/TusC family protein